MTERRRGVLLPALGVVLMAGAVFWGLRREPAQESAPTVPRAPDVSPPVEEVPAPAAPPRQSRSSAPPPPPSAAGAPAGCPGEELLDPPGFVRPSTWDLFVVRTMELRDRLPQFTRDSSPAMRRGLTSLNDAAPDLDAFFEAPDRHQDGFDLAMAALLHLGTRALSRRAMDDAHRLATRAMREAPTDPLAHVLSATVAERTHRTTDALSAHRRAAELAPDEPAILLAQARAASAAGEFAEARDAADAYLALEPRDTRIRSWRARMHARAEVTSRFVRGRGAGVVVLHPAGLQRGQVDRLITTVRGAMDETARLLDRDRRPELAVVVYPSVEGMRDATCAPSWSGGVFDGVLHLSADTVEREAVHTIRHEATHAQLALVRGRIPHWLNEGLAQHMEGEVRDSTRASWGRMVERRFWIPFASLEGQLVVIDDAGDARLAYHQSLAMVRWLLDARGARVLRDAADRIEARQEQDLMEQLVPGADGEAMLAYLARALAAEPR
ncbi:MAG: hypothetical protein AB8I08_38395 [Sandaracinaceae bacterium]